jgi:hypothetical protein
MLVNIHQPKNFGRSYMIYILHPEDACTNQEEICSPCQIDSEDEEYVITRGMLFSFNCEKHEHIEIECHE